MRLAAIFGLLLLTGLSAAAKNPPCREFSKTINREFGTLANGMAAFYNKHGAVNVKTWANNSVKIDVIILVDADNEHDAERVFKRINVNFTNTPGYIKAETFVDGTNGWWGDDKGDEYKINYDVWMPASNSLDLKNRYGNAFVASLKGKLMAEIKFGDLRTEALAGDADVNISYGKASIAKTVNLYGSVSYGGLDISEVRDVQLDTKYSELHIEKANSVRLTSKYDNRLDFGWVDDLRLQTKYADVNVEGARQVFITAQFSDVRINNVAELVDANLLYGSMELTSLKRGFQSVNFEGKYADCEIHVDRGTPYRFDIQGSFADMDFPDDASFKVREERGNTKKMEGYVGEGNAKGLIKARLTYGGLSLD